MTWFMIKYDDLCSQLHLMRKKILQLLLLSLYLLIPYVRWYSFVEHASIIKGALFSFYNFTLFIERDIGKLLVMVIMLLKPMWSCVFMTPQSKQERDQRKLKEETRKWYSWRVEFDMTWIIVVKRRQPALYSFLDAIPTWKSFLSHVVTLLLFWELNLIPWSMNMEWLDSCRY